MGQVKGLKVRPKSTGKGGIKWVTLCNAKGRLVSEHDRLWKGAELLVVLPDRRMR